SHLCHVSLRARRRPIPTPFPYTTLFRSSQACLGSSLVSPAVGRDRLLAAMTRLSGRLPGGAVIIDLLKQDPVLSPLLELRGERLDRKSTRLNSSHVKIAYAVFCLKKKRY